MGIWICKTQWPNQNHSETDMLLEEILLDSSFSSSFMLILLLLLEILWYDDYMRWSDLNVAVSMLGVSLDILQVNRHLAEEIFRSSYTKKPIRKCMITEFSRLIFFITLKTKTDTSSYTIIIISKRMNSYLFMPNWGGLS